MNRREMLKGLGATVGLGWAAAAKAAEQTGTAGPAESRSGDMIYRTLGRTGQKTSALGVGGFHIGKLPSQDECVRFIRTAIDRGVTFMDNSWDYHEGRSEEWMGAALRDGYRDKVFLMSKLDGRTKASAARQIDESLKRFKVDMIDLMQIHEIIRLEDPDRCFEEEGAVAALKEAQKAGKIRYTGFTGHKDPFVHLRMLEIADQHKFHFDAVQMPLNLLDAHFRSFARQVLPVLVEKGIAVLGMKPMASGDLLKSGAAKPEECLRYALSLPTSVVISGMDSPKLLEANLATVKNYTPLAGGELAAVLAKAVEPARGGKFERFKTTAAFDATTFNPQWLG